MVKKKVNWILFCLLLASCDFSSRLQKEILSAQESISAHKYARAVSHYEEAVKLNPPNEAKVKILYQLGELNTVHLARHRTAIDYFKQIIKVSINPLWQVKAKERIAEINFTILKDYFMAKKAYQTLVSYKPELDDKEFYEFRMAVSSLNDGQYSEAHTLFKSMSANANHQFNTDAWYYKALCSMFQKKWERAEKDISRYLQLERRRDKIVQGRFILANILETQENLKAAYEMYYSILGEYPNTEVVKNRLDSLYQRRIARKR